MKRINTLLIIAFAISSSIINAQSLTDSLLIHYELNGNAVDSSGNSYNGTLHGAVTTADRFGNPSGALKFDGIDDYLDGGSPLNIRNFDAVTMSAWFKCGSNPSYTNAFTGVSFGSKAVGRISIRIRDNSDYRFQSVLSDSAEFNAIAKKSFLADTNWHHVLGIFKDSSIQLFVDGVEQYLAGNVGSQPVLLDDLPQYPNLYIGSVPVNTSAMNHFFKGSLDDIRVYNRALDTTEIQALYQFNPNDSICTQTIFDTISVFDTTNVSVFDTVQVVDTAIVNVFDTIQILDTTIVSIYDTIRTQVFDSTLVTVYDTILTQVIDTTWITIYDTIIQYDTIAILLDPSGTGNYPNELADITIYPNPSSGPLTIDIETNNLDFGGYFLLLRDVTGKTLGQFFVEQSTSAINLNSLGAAKGVIFIDVMDDNEVLLDTKQVIYH